MTSQDLENVIKCKCISIIPQQISASKWLIHVGRLCVDLLKQTIDMYIVVRTVYSVRYFFCELLRSLRHASQLSFFVQFGIRIHLDTPCQITETKITHRRFKFWLNYSVKPMLKSMLFHRSWLFWLAGSFLPGSQKPCWISMLNNYWLCDKVPQ